MGRKKRRGRSRAHALSPVNKNGIKLGTLVTELGLIAAVMGEPRERAMAGDWGTAGAAFVSNLNPSKTTSGKMIWTGVAISLIGRFTGFKRFGPIQLS